MPRIRPKRFARKQHAAVLSPPNLCRNKTHQAVTRNAVAYCAMLLAVSPSIASADAPVCAGQDFSDKVANGAFNSIVDGQPPSPDHLQFQQILTYDRQARQFTTTTGFGITSFKTGFGCQSQLSLTLPAVSFGNGSTDIIEQVSFAWEQRWVQGSETYASFSTNLTANLSFGSQAGTSMLEGTLIVVKPLEKGAMYLNASVQTRPGFSLNSLLWSGLVGIKHEIREGFEVYTDILVETGQTVTYELSADVDLSDGWSIGPGIAYSKSLDSQGSLRRFPLSQFHQFFPECFCWRSPTQTLAWYAVQAVTNRLHISI